MLWVFTYICTKNTHLDDSVRAHAVELELLLHSFPVCNIEESPDVVGFQSGTNKVHQLGDIVSLQPVGKAIENRMVSELDLHISIEQNLNHEKNTKIRSILNKQHTSCQ